MQKLLTIAMLSTLVGVSALAKQPKRSLDDTTRVVISSGEWRLIGDLTLPSSEGPSPAVLLLNKAAGNRASYEPMAEQLVKRGIASLRLDLRGHGESTNKGEFVPGEGADFSLIFEAETDVAAALSWLRSHERIDAKRIAIVGASYSGEEMAEAGRRGGLESAYVALSPGSLGDESIGAIDGGGKPFLLVVARDDPFLKEITAETQKRSQTAEVWILPGASHATDMFESQADLAERVAVWLFHRLSR